MWSLRKLTENPELDHGRRPQQLEQHVAAHDRFRLRQIPDTATVQSVRHDRLWCADSGMLRAVAGAGSEKHWHKGRMFTAYGLAVAIPGLLVLAASGVTLLLVEAFHIPDALIFSKAGLPILLKPVALATLIPAAYGVLFTVIGICTNAAVKSKRKRLLPSVHLSPMLPHRKHLLRRLRTMHRLNRNSATPKRPAKAMLPRPMILLP